MADPFDLDRFVQAQAPVYASVLHELRSGKKTSHWMWFVFPQLAGLGRSPTAQHYAITSLEEARAYLNHPLLGARLYECIQILQTLTGTSADGVFGSVDAAKLRSSLTLFARADPHEPLFEQALERWFGGGPDPLTLQLLRSA